MVPLSYYLVLSGILFACGVTGFLIKRNIITIFMRESRKEVPVAPISPGLGVALAISIVATLYLGLLPNRLLQITQHSAQSVLPGSTSSPGMAQNLHQSNSANE